MRLSDRTYDILKWIQKIFVLLATFYATVANIWGLPYGDEISKTCLALASVLLGILEIASATYNKDLTEINTDDLEGEDLVEESVG